MSELISRQLKPCPFCGCIPKLYWERWNEISERAGTYVLEANHSRDCFIYQMNGMNTTGKATSHSARILIEMWNTRLGEYDD